PNAQPRINRRRGLTSGAGFTILSFCPQFQRVQSHDGFRVSERDRGGIWIAAVDQQIYVGFFSGAHAARVIRWDHPPPQNPVAVDPALDGSIVVGVSDNLEVSRTSKLVDQLAAFSGLIRVVDHGGNLVHVEAQGESEEQQHQDGHGKRHSQAAPIAQNMASFLASDGGDTAHVHTALGSRSATSIMATNPSSMLASIGAILSTETPSRSIASFRRGIATDSSSTVMWRLAPNTATSTTPGWPWATRMLSNRLEETSS